MNVIETTFAIDRMEWRLWLENNHNSKNGIWLIYYKKHTGKASITYVAAVEEAICFGWIDGQNMEYQTIASTGLTGQARSPVKRILAA